MSTDPKEMTNEIIIDSLEEFVRVFEPKFHGLDKAWFPRIAEAARRLRALPAVAPVGIPVLTDSRPMTPEEREATHSFFMSHFKPAATGQAVAPVGGQIRGKLICAGELTMMEADKPVSVTGVLIETSREELHSLKGNMLYSDVVVSEATTGQAGTDDNLAFRHLNDTWNEISRKGMDHHALVIRDALSWMAQARADCEMARDLADQWQTAHEAARAEVEKDRKWNEEEHDAAAGVIADAMNEATALRERVKVLEAALRHMQVCQSCSEGPWEDCDEGRKALAALTPPAASGGGT